MPSLQIAFCPHSDSFPFLPGVYLPLHWEPSFCSRSPIALGYTRGHFCALVPPEPTSAAAACASSSSHASSAGGDKSAFLPLMGYDQKVLPIHFLAPSELGREESILKQWLDVGVTDGGLWVAQQKIAKPPLLVAQMTEEWLNHYRKLAYVVTTEEMSTCVTWLYLVSVKAQ